MNLSKAHYSRNLISVHFERLELSGSRRELLEKCKDFMFDLAQLASASNQRLRGSYSVVGGVNGYHAHFAVNWLPSYLSEKRNKHGSFNRIDREVVTEVLENNGFYVDNPKEAIKVVTHDRQRVYDYVFMQPKHGQTAIFTGYYKHDIKISQPSRNVLQSYCRPQFFAGSGKLSTASKMSLEIIFTFLVFLLSIMISDYLGFFG